MAKIRISENVLRDAHQSLHATRMVTADMLPIAEKLDKAGFWSLESWGGATFDSCIRFLNEDPWERMRQLKKAMPNTPHQMLLRGQSILGYRHYADDVVEKCVERMAVNGVDVFRVFDALNDPRNFLVPLKAVVLKIAATEEFADRQRRTLSGARIIAERLSAADVAGKGITVLTGGTDVHLVLVDLRTVLQREAPAGEQDARVDVEEVTDTVMTYFTQDDTDVAGRQRAVTFRKKPVKRCTIASKVALRSC